MVGATGGISVSWGLMQDRVNRQESQTLQEYNGLVVGNAKFLRLITAFTEEIALTGSADAAKRTELSGALSDLYTDLGSFAWNVPQDQRITVERAQASINEVRKQVQLIKTKSDLDPLAVAFRDYHVNMEAAQPVLQSAAGRAVVSSS